MINPQAAAVPHSSTFQDAYTSYVSMAQVKLKGYKVTYHSDGSGRDTYINRNAGGLYAPYVPTPGPGVSSFN